MGTGFPTFLDAEFTLSVWVKTADPAFWIAAGKHWTGFFNGYLIGGNDVSGYGAPGKAWVYTGHAPVFSPISTTTVTNNQWHQITSVRRGTTSYIFVDGALENTSLAGNSPTSPAPFIVGGAALSGVPGGLFNGLIDEVQVFDEPLCPDVVQHFADHPNDSPSTFTNLNGTVNLEDWGASTVGLPADVEIVDCFSTVKQSSSVSLGANGSFVVSTQLKGPYLVRVKVSHWLSKGIMTTFGTGATSPTWALLNGDIDEDNSVTLLDYDIFSAYFDKSSGDADWNVVGPNGFKPKAADLDGDDFVTLIDYDVFSKNFDKSGD